MGNRNEFKRKKAGFTLPEVLLVLGILTVLLALAVPGVLAIQANAKQTELDATAKQIFLAAQSVLTARQSSAEAGGIGGAVVEEQPSDFPDDLPWQQGEYFYVTQANAKQLLPMGSIDETVRRNYYVIEYCPSTGAIYGVFYAESEITYSASLPRTDRDARKSAKLGYYGGAGLDVSQSGQLQTPDFQVVNEDRLYVRLTAQEQVQYTISVTQAGTEKTRTFTFTSADKTNVSSRYPNYMSYQKTDGNEVYELLLDSLDAGRTFEKLYGFNPSMTPGADLTIEVTAAGAASGDTRLPASETKTVNSLFDSRYLDSTTGLDTVAVSCGRHLQNLSDSVSGVTPSVRAAVQLNDIDWPQTQAFVPINNAALCGFDGNLFELRNLNLEGASYGKGFGLFGELLCPDAILIQNVRLVDAVLASDAQGYYVGVLAGNAVGAAFQNCQVYYRDLARQLDLQNAGVVGGLVGTAMDCTFFQCSASLPGIRSTASVTGGLVGSIFGGAIEQCYAATGVNTDGGWSGGLLGGQTLSAGLVGQVFDGVTIDSCYAVGYIDGSVQAVGLCYVDQGAADVQIKDSYAAVEFSDKVTDSYGFSNVDSLENCFYLETVSPLQPEEQAQKKSYGALRTCFSRDLWALGAEVTTKPYGLSGAYAFLQLKAMTHYGDWPLERQVEGKALGFVYYEQYDTGVYGFFGPEVEGGSTLKGNEAEIIDSGYGLIVSDGTDPTTGWVSYSWGSPWGELQDPYGAKRDWNPSDGVTLYPLTQATLQRLSELTGTYAGIELYVHYQEQTSSFFLNPRFGASVVSLEQMYLLGTQAAPYQLRTQSHLKALQDVSIPVYTLQTHDITAAGMASIDLARALNYGQMILDGGGNCIYGLSQPLFSDTPATAMIQNLRIEDADITLSGSVTAGVLANSNGAAVKNCIVTNCSISAPEGAAAGFIGTNSHGGTISNSYANCQVSGTEAAGFAYSNSGTIRNCYALLQVRADVLAAGFVCAGYGTLETCYSAAAVEGAVGAQAYGFGAVYTAVGKDCYYLAQDGLMDSGKGAAKTYTELTKLSMGTAWAAATPATSHPASSYLSSMAYPFPKLAGLDHYGDWPVNAEASGLAYYECYEGGAYGLAGDGLPQSSPALNDVKRVVQFGYGVVLSSSDDPRRYYAQLDSSQTQYTNFLQAEGFDLSGALTFYPFTQTAQAQLQADMGDRPYGRLDVVREGGRTLSYFINLNYACCVVSQQELDLVGTERLPYQIRTQQHLANLCRESPAKAVYFQQTRPIETDGWNTADLTTALKTARPVFNGGGYAITNLQQPLFGTVGEGWTLKSVNLVGAELACSDAGATVGIICSELYGDLFECIVSDSSVSNTGGAAGLVGSAYPGSEIRRCYANCAVTGAKASGLTGLSAGTIQDCYVAGTVEGTQQAAGFTLLYYETTMPKTCYSVAEIRCSTASVYGFAPMQSVGKKPIALEDCYYLFRSGINPAKDAAQKRQYQQMTGSGFLVELGSQWEWATQETSHPISGELWTSAYPFPKLKNLDHFGDWPLEGK